MDIIFIYTFQGEQFPVGQSATSTISTTITPSSHPSETSHHTFHDLRTENEALREKVESLKDELQELYVKYDQMAAAFGEMNYLIREASAVHARHLQEDML